MHGSFDYDSKTVSELSEGCDDGDLNLCVLRGFYELQYDEKAAKNWFLKGCHRVSIGCFQVGMMDLSDHTHAEALCKKRDQISCINLGKKHLKRGEKELAKKYFKFSCIHNGGYGFCRALDSAKDLFTQEEKNEIQKVQSENDENYTNLESINNLIWDYRQEKGYRPSHLEALNSRIKLIDTWGTPIKYIKHLKSDRLVSAGADTQFGTDDDIWNITFYQKIFPLYGNK